MQAMVASLPTATVTLLRSSTNSGSPEEEEEAESAADTRADVGERLPPPIEAKASRPEKERIHKKNV